MNEKTKGAYRLTTEDVKEYALRQELKQFTPLVIPFTQKDANYFESKIRKPVVLRGYKPNAFGLYGMHGNVGEWCEGWKEDYPKGSVADPKDPDYGERRALRSGSFFNAARHTGRPIASATSPPVNRYLDLGLRNFISPEICVRVRDY